MSHVTIEEGWEKKPLSNDDNCPHCDSPEVKPNEERGRAGEHVCKSCSTKFWMSENIDEIKEKQKHLKPIKSYEESSPPRKVTGGKMFVFGSGGGNV